MCHVLLSSSCLCLFSHPVVLLTCVPLVNHSCVFKIHSLLDHLCFSVLSYHSVSIRWYVTFRGLALDFVLLFRFLDITLPAFSLPGFWILHRGFWTLDLNFISIKFAFSFPICLSGSFFWQNMTKTKGYQFMWMVHCLYQLLDDRWQIAINKGIISSLETLTLLSQIRKPTQHIRTSFKHLSHTTASIRSSHSPLTRPLFLQLITLCLSTEYLKINTRVYHWPESPSIILKYLSETAKAWACMRAKLKCFWSKKSSTDRL